MSNRKLYGKNKIFKMPQSVISPMTPSDRSLDPQFQSSQLCQSSQSAYSAIPRISLFVPDHPAFGARDPAA